MNINAKSFVSAFFSQENKFFDDLELKYVVDNKFLFEEEQEKVEELKIQISKKQLPLLSTILEHDNQ